MPQNAQLGYVGHVSFDNTKIRATTADIRVTQTVDKPDVVDGKVDKTVYQLGPKEVGGTVGFPGIHEDGTGVIRTLWDYTLQRASNGQMLHYSNIDVKYANGVGYRYPNCMLDSFEWNVTHEDIVNITINVIGTTRTDIGSFTEPSYNFRNSRIVTWNDAVVELYSVASGGNPSVESSEVRSFTATVANNGARYFTLNGSMFPNPQAIAPTKRDIDGSIVIMGRSPFLKDQAFTNQDRCNEKSAVRFGYTITDAAGECPGSFTVRIPGVVFEIEELSLSNDLFETTVNWHALPGITYGDSGLDTTFVEGSGAS